MVAQLQYYHNADYYLSHLNSSGGTSTTGSTLDPISIFLLRFISNYLDRYNAMEWNLTYVAITTTVVLGIIRIVFQKYYGIDWYAFIHAILSSTGSLMCLYLNFITSHQLSATTSTTTGVAVSSLLTHPEPLRSMQCHGPFTSLHRILPAITMGYSLFDFYDGLTISVDFMIHGLATFTIMYCFNYVFDAPHIMAPMLFMEGSTIFLTIVKADFLPSSIVFLNQMLFTLAFFVCRLVVVPYFWMELMITMYQQQNDIAFQQCFPSHFIVTCFVFGMFYNILNTYWFIKIIRKARRKILGIEKPKEKNDLSDEAHPSAKLSSISLQDLIQQVDNMKKKT
jgi:TLC domain